MTHLLEDRDPGLQPERTALSWTRTSLAMMANGLLLVGRDVLVGDWHATTGITCAVALLGALTVYLIGHRRGARLLAGTRSRAPIAIVATGFGVILLCVTLFATALATSA
ncbi:DUF202 domain-containing protein [Nocardia camponoti]|uniref:DUF202 domain-containing protein n=1 Tax=Nocardia camponoti TaxID=1616106 RepID=A0A917QDH4_9NOCA|nr:DUF202 domain-containing protein [Nocardia camponoti]GGK44644.1 hypothetical protein GCM10011591_15300 [Nocardia camponoti]